MNRTLPFMFGRIFNTPLLVAPAKLEAFMLELPGLFERGLRLDDDEGDGAPPRRSAGYAIRDGVATIPVHGVLVRRAGQIDATSSAPLMSYERIGQIVRSAVSDSRVRALLLDMDTPGGEAGGIFDLASDIRAAAAVKPVWSISNDDAFSAGYALASAASSVWLTKTAGVGSIGVVAVHTDQSGYDKQAGLKYSFIHAGARKVDGTSHAPLSPEARARIQTEVDRLHGMFVDQVAGHRRMEPAAVRATEAGLYFGDEAVFAGLADQVGTPAEAAAALAAHAAPSSRKASLMSETEQPKDPPPGDKPAEKPADPQQQPQQQPEQPAQQPAAQPQQSAEVIALAAASQSREQAIEITELCALAGRPELATEMLKASLTVEQVRRQLVKLQAEAQLQRAAAIAPIDPATFAGNQPGGTAPPPITAREAYGRVYAKKGA